MLKAVKKSLQ